MSEAWTDDEIDALLSLVRRVREAYDRELGYQSVRTRTAGARPYAEVAARLAEGEAGRSEDLTDSEIFDFHEREARECFAAALGRPLPPVPEWAERDPRLDNAMRLALADLVSRADARGVVHTNELDEGNAALDRLRDLRVIARVGASAWRVAVRA